MTNKSLGTFINPFTDNSSKAIYSEANVKLNKLVNMPYEDHYTYELSLKYYRDFINVLDTAKKEEEEEIALKMLQKNTDIDFIAEVTGLSKKTVENLKFQNRL